MRFDTSEIKFSNKRARLKAYIRGTDAFAFGVRIDCWHRDWQVFSVARVSNAISQVLSAMVHLTFEHEIHSQSSEEHNDVERVEWRNLIRSFSNVKTLRVEDGLAED